MVLCAHPPSSGGCVNHADAKCSRATGRLCREHCVAIPYVANACYEHDSARPPGSLPPGVIPAGLIQQPRQPRARSVSPSSPPVDVAQVGAMGSPFVVSEDIMRTVLSAVAALTAKVDSLSSGVPAAVAPSSLSFAPSVSDPPCRSATRVEALAAAASANTQLFGLNPGNQQQVNEFMNRMAADDDGKVNAADTTAAAAADTYYSSGAPGGGGGALHGRDFPVVLSLQPAASGTTANIVSAMNTAILAANKKHKSFANVFELTKALKQQFQLLLDLGTRDTVFIRAFHRYEMYILDLSVEYGFQTAQSYHWYLFQMIEDREHDLVRDSHFSIQAWSRLSDKLKVKLASRVGPKHDKSLNSPSGSSHNSKAGTHAAGSCTNHPTSTSHTTAQCKGK